MYLSIHLYYIPVEYHTASLSDISDMNRELHTLILYTRAEIMLVKKQNNHAAGNNMFGVAFDEVTEILSGIVQTLDNVITLGGSSWNALILAHIIQAFTIHLFDLKTCREAANMLGTTMLSLDMNYVRIHCHVTTVIDMCKANLVILCSSVVPSGRKAETNCSGMQGLCKVQANCIGMQGSCKVQTNSSSPVAFKSVVATPTRLTRSYSNVTRSFSEGMLGFGETSRGHMVRDALFQHERIRGKLFDRKLLNVHTTANCAMVNSLSGGLVETRVHSWPK
jgi:hypothetical protein